MYIVTATNDSYAKHLGVMLHSLLENLENKTNINIFIIGTNISGVNKIKLQKIVGRYGLQLTFLTINDHNYRSFRKVRYFTKEAYYRILIPELLGKDIAKALYLDCDLIIKEDLSKLWNINIDDYYVAAVEALAINKKKKKALSIPPHSIYFNSGVLLINLQKWRENNISTKIINFIEENHTKLKLPDQDALSAILHDKCLKVGLRWNYTTLIHRMVHLDNPAIIHFTGPKKPWKAAHPFRAEYLKYLHSSQWNQLN